MIGRNYLEGGVQTLYGSAEEEFKKGEKSSSLVDTSSSNFVKNNNNLPSNKIKIIPSSGASFKKEGRLGSTSNRSRNLLH